MNNADNSPADPVRAPGDDLQLSPIERAGASMLPQSRPMRLLLVAPPDGATPDRWRRILGADCEIEVAATHRDDVAAGPPSSSPSPFDVIVDHDAGDGGRTDESIARRFARLRPGGAYVIDTRGAGGGLPGRALSLGEPVVGQAAAIEVREGLLILRRGDASASVPDQGAEDLKHLESRLAQAKRELQVSQMLHRAKLAEIDRSSSWRATRPLRWAGRHVLSLRRMARRWPAMAQEHGGAIGAARHLAGVLRRGGWAGLESTLRMVADPSGSYRLWVDCHDTLDAEARTRMQAAQAAWPRRPLITVLMPTYNSNPAWLSEAIESVRSQIYTNWELCIADDASPDDACREVLRQYAAMDERIKVVFRTQNGHISLASNSALELATGEWTALLDHDDLLSPQALYRIAEAVRLRPDVRLVYSDEDKIDEKGNRSGPYFKPDWNPDLFYSQNMFSHLGAFHTGLLREVGGFRQGMEGSQDYDLVLRCIERLRPDQIVHVPRVLYHWRVHSESTAGSMDAKPYAQLAGERALNAHFQRRGVRGNVEIVRNGYRARYDLPDVVPRVSLIIPTRNAVALVRQCIDSIVKLTIYDDYEIILVDNGSDAPEAIAYFAELATRPGIRVVRDDGEFNYSALNNRAVELATGELVALINNDIEVVSPEWLREMVSLALQPGVGAVGARLWYPDGTLQHGGVVLGVGGIASHAHKKAAASDPGYGGRAALIQSFSAVTAACLVVRKDLYQAAGGLDETNLKVAYNDIDFCLRLRAMGLRNVWTPYAELVHHESATRGLDESEEKKARFQRETDHMRSTWGALIENDPAYNPNLTLHADDFGLAWPPRLESP